MYPVDSKALTGITVADCFAGIGAFHLAFKHNHWVFCTYDMRNRLGIRF